MNWMIQKYIHHFPKLYPICDIFQGSISSNTLEISIVWSLIIIPYYLTIKKPSIFECDHNFLPIFIDQLDFFFLLFFDCSNQNNNACMKIMSRLHINIQKMFWRHSIQWIFFKKTIVKHETTPWKTTLRGAVT